jgi:hypothetical protein
MVHNPDSNSFGFDPPGAHDSADPQPKGEFDGRLAIILKKKVR